MDLKTLKQAKKQTSKLNKYVPKVDIPKIDVSKVSVDSLIPKVEMPNVTMDSIKAQVPEVNLDSLNPENTIVGDIKHELQDQSKLYAKQMEEQGRLFAQQIDLLTKQNQLLNDNYNKLKDLYDKQVEAYDGSQLDLEQSRSYNRWMMIIAIVAMLAAIAGPIVTILVS